MDHTKMSSLGNFVVTGCAGFVGSTRTDALLAEGDFTRGDARWTAADTSSIRAGLGWRPATSLEEGLAAQLEWIRRPSR